MPGVKVMSRTDDTGGAGDWFGVVTALAPLEPPPHPAIATKTANARPLDAFSMTNSPSLC
jgi:hypothetical protein